MNSSEKLSAGLKALPDKVSSFASTQAVWRFYANESVTLSKLQEPLTAAAREGIALWYYWRWQIECFFKLLKSVGHHLEAWQQESALAIAKRLLVASMASVTVWEIAADETQEAADLRGFLVKLSGRQMRRKKEFTPPALLAGLWVFLSMLEIMDAYSQDELDDFKATAQQFSGKVV